MPRLVSVLAVAAVVLAATNSVSPAPIVPLSTSVLVRWQSAGADPVERAQPLAQSLHLGEPEPSVPEDESRAIWEEKRATAEHEFGDPVPRVETHGALEGRIPPAAEGLPVPDEVEPAMEPRWGLFRGRGSWYPQGGGVGACGRVHSDWDTIVAVNPAQFAGSCGKKVLITSGGKSITAVVADKCPGCGWGSLDLSKGAFARLAGLAEGIVGISWRFE